MAHPVPPRTERRRSLRRQLLRLGIGPCAATALALTGWFTHERLQLQDTAFAAQNMLVARQVAALADLSLYAGDQAALQSLAASTVAARMADRVEISNHAGLFIAAGRAPLTHAALGMASAPVLLARWINLSDYPEQPPAQTAGRPPRDATPVGAVRIYRDAAAHVQQRRRTLLWGLLPGLACLLLAALAARRIARGVLRPLARIDLSLADLEAGLPAGPALAGLRMHRTPTELLALADRVSHLSAALQNHRQQAERRVRQAREEALDSIAQVHLASRARARFLASASHDLRQPLHAMGLFIDSLQAAHVPGQETALRRLQESTQIMGRLLDDLLDISRLDAQVYTPELAAIPLAAVFGQLDTLYRPQAALTGVELHWRDGRHVVLADAALLLRIVGNLVANALRHSNATRVIVTARRDGALPDGRTGIRVAVRDNGRGIAAIHHDSIFEEFFQIANAERDARKGFGLGLSICARGAQVLGTAMTLQSAIGRGSVFSLALPTAAPPPDMVQTGAQPHHPAAGPLFLRCLVVDDDDAIRDASIERLQQWGCEVDIAADEESAAARLDQAEVRYDVVLCDLQLRGATDGLHVLALAAQHQPQALRVMVSGATAPDTLRQLRQAGITLLTKPVAPARLRALLASAQKSPQPLR